MCSLIDESTGRYVTNAELSTSTDATARLTSEGVGGLCGVPSRLFPGLALNPFDFDLTVVADSFETFVVAGQIGAQAGFPDTFVPAPSMDILLRRKPVSVFGRVTEIQLGVPVGSAFADVQIVGYWTTLADFVSGAAATPTDFVTVEPSLYGPVDQAGSTVDCVTVSHPGTPIPLAEAVSVGQSVAVLSERGNVQPGDVLTFEPGVRYKEEHLVVRNVTGPADPQSPSTVETEYPFKSSHATGSEASLAQVSVDSSTALTSHSRASDAVLFLASNTLANDPTPIRLSGPGVSDQFVNAHSPSIQSDGDGYYRLAPVARVQVVVLQATSGALSSPLSNIALDHAKRESRADLTVS